MSALSQSSEDRLIQMTRKRGMSETAFAEMITHLCERRAQRLAVTDEAVGWYAETLAESVFTDSQPVVPDCQTCGACCAFFHQIAVLDSDPTPRRLTWAVWDDAGVAGPKTRWLRREADEGRCVAFKGGVGQYAHCAIYELRPASCRAFEAGSDRCRAVRRAYGLEPPLSEDARVEQAGRIEPDAGEWDRVEALERRQPLSFGERERAELLAEMIAHHRARIREIADEAARLHALLAGQGIQSATQTAAHYADAINEEARAVTSAGDEARIEKTELLDLAAQSQAALTRATRWLVALGELVFDAFGMRVELASTEPTNKSREAEC
jgi:Fe-S-cluster containining protein